MELKSLVLFFTLLSSIAAFTLQNELNQLNDSDSSLSLFHSHDCKCKNGRCVKDNKGKTKCNCKRGYSLQDENTCERCDCGDLGKCMFLQVSSSRGGVSLYIKKCLCDVGSAEKDGVCVDCHCGENSKCEFENGEKNCYCIEGYADKDGICTKCDCGEYGECTFKNGQKVCTCDEDFEEINGYCVDKCDSVNCRNEGTCKIENGVPLCECIERFEGKECETDKCSYVNCQNGGKCKIENGKPDCECPERYTGENCMIDKCSQITCLNGGACDMQDGKPVCKCLQGYHGDQCEIDECASTSCHNGGECFMVYGRAVCKCPERYEGDRCEIDKCADVKCENGGSCVMQNGDAVCQCQVAYEGERCERHKCLNVQCHNGGICDILDGNTLCRCRDRYTGQYCEVDQCQYLHCQNGGKCVGKDGKAVCECTPNYSGMNCEIPTCSTDYPCQNGGICREGRCDCLRGTSGGFCDVIDECFNLCPKRSDINCTYDVKNERAYCDCFDRQLGFNPETQQCERTCDTNDCKNGGSCEERGHSRFCRCLPGTNGEFCELIPVCQGLDCGNEAHCAYNKDMQTPFCQCNDPALVLDLEDRTCKKPCRNSSDCLNGGTCIPAPFISSLGYCRCLDGTKGDLCEEVPGCINKECGDSAKCEYDVERRIAMCKCIDNNYQFDPVDFRCKKKCRDPADCKNGGTCTGDEFRQSYDSLFCQCLCGTKGDFCEEVPWCDNKDCGHEAKCGFDLGRSSPGCICNDRSLFFDDMSKTCRNMCHDSSECKNGGTCTVGERGSFCRCLNGTIGDFCEDVSGCNNKDCGNEAICGFDAKRKSASCKCHDPRLAFDEISKVCKRSCVNDSLCKNGGICMPRGYDRFCHCAEGTSGDFCENVKICNEVCGMGEDVGCKYDPQQKTAECICKHQDFEFDFDMKYCKPCYCGGNEISCSVHDGKKTCVCPDGYADKGGKCEKQRCTDRQCTNGLCEVVNNEEICTCYEGFFLDGDECRRKVCAKTPCLNGTCVVRNDGREECICPAGYTLRFNQCIRGACRFDTCFGGQCKVIDGELLCKCPERFSLEGIGCFETVCKIQRCFGGKCVVENGEEICTCPEGHILENDVCKRILCEKKNCFGGQCHIRDGAEECECPLGYSIIDDVCVRNGVKSF